MIKTGHNAGFFSCCSVKLHHITMYVNSNKKLPDGIDSSKQFAWYKKNTDRDKDITYHYFEHYDTIKNTEIHFPITYNWNHQFIHYSDLDYNRITPLIKKYFSPSVEINEIVNNMKQIYKLNFENICVLFYRGNDKNIETKTANYDEYLNYANQIIIQNPDILFLIQSDETEFIEFMTNKFPHNSFYFKDEIRHMKKCNDTVDKKMKSQNYDFSKKYLAITIIMSKCKFIICGSGNCDMWIMFYRGNNNNVIQYLNGTWYNN
jgi:hypothetical protein